MSAAAPTTAPPVTDRTQQVVAELQACWGQLPNKDLFLVLTGAWLVLLSFLGNSTFGYVVTRSLPLWMFNAYTAPQSEDGHGLLMPLVVAYLFYVRRHYILGGQLRLWWPGLLVLGAACGLHGLGFLVQQPRLSILALLGGLYGIMGTCWGPGFLRRSFFPFWMNEGIAVDLRGGGDEEARALVLRQAERLVRAERADFERLDGEFEVIHRAGGRGEMPDEIHRLLEEDELSDILLNELEGRVPTEVSNVLDAAGDEVIQADDPVAARQQKVGQMRAEEASGTSDDGDRLSGGRRGIGGFGSWFHGVDSG